MAEDEVKSGYVHKCGKSVKSWKRRWFVLKRNGYLYYYTDSSAKVEKGKIDAVDAASVSPYNDKTKGAEHPPPNLSPGNAFLIVTKERVFTCVCETLDERGSWLAALEKIRGVATADQQYPAPTYPKSPGQAPPITTPLAVPPPYTPQAQGPPLPTPQGHPMPAPQRPPTFGPQGAPMPPYTVVPPQPQAPQRPPPVGYAGAQSYPPRYYQPPPPQQPPVAQYQQQPRPPMAPYPQPAYRPAPQPAYTAPPPAGYQYPPRPPPGGYYPQQYYRPPAHSVVQRNTTTVTVVSVPPPQRHVIIRR